MKAYIDDFGGVNLDIMSYFTKVLEPSFAEINVLWQDVEYYAPLTIKDGHKHGVRTVVVMHAVTAGTDYVPPYKMQPIADKYCCWGSADFDNMIRAGVPSNKLVVTSNPLVSKFKVDKIPHEDKNVIFVPMHWDEELNIGADVTRELRKCKHNVSTKIIDGHDKAKYINPIESSRQDPVKHIDKCVEVLQTADVVVTNFWSTFVAYAFVMDVPVIFCDSILDTGDEWSYKALIGYDRTDGGLDGMTFSPLKDLNKTIDAIVGGEDEKKSQRSAAASYYTGCYIDNPIAMIIKEIYETYKGK